MVHITVTAAGGGAMLKPHFATPNTAMKAENYIDMLRQDNFPQITSLMPAGKAWCFQQDLASPHTARGAMDFIAQRGVALLPWMPSGADCDPLDIYANPELEKRLRGNNLSAREKMIESRARALAEPPGGPAFKESLGKCWRSIKQRCKWAQAFCGRIITSSLVNAWDGQAAL